MAEVKSLPRPSCCRWGRSRAILVIGRAKHLVESGRDVPEAVQALEEVVLLLEKQRAATAIS